MTVANCSHFKFEHVKFKRIVHKVNKASINIMADDDSNYRPIALHDGFATMESAIATS